MKKFLVPVAVGAVVFGAVTAFAASLTVNTDSLGAGDKVVNACNDNAAVSYTPTYDVASKTYQVKTVSITTSGASTTGCGGMHFQVTLSKSDGSALGTELSGTLQTDGTGTATVATGPAASLVQSASVVITG